MQYNVAKEAYVTENTDIGNVTLSANEIIELLDYSEDSVVTMSDTADSILVLDCDLGVRLDIDKIGYYFESTIDQSAIASGIRFQYRNEPFQSYISLETLTSSPDYYYATVTGTVFAPRDVRLTHTMTDTYLYTSVTGTVHGFEVINNENEVNFGTDGTKTEENVAIAREGAASVRSIPIYNSSDRMVDALATLEPSYDDLDQVLAISDSEDGPWTYPLDEGSVIINSDNFSSGTFSNVQTTGNVLKLTGYIDRDDYYISRLSSGNYTTRVFERTGTEQNLLQLDKNLPVPGGRLAISYEDNVDTVYIRSSNSPPKPYSVYRYMYSYYDYPSRHIAFKDRWRDNDQIKYTSTWYWKTVSWRMNLREYFIVMDSSNDRWAGFIAYSSDSLSYSQMYAFNNINESSAKSKLLQQHSTSGSLLNFSWREARLDSEGGMWVYFYAQSYSSSQFVDNTGYYLVYWDSSFTTVFKYYNVFDFVTAFSVDYDNRFLWYTRNDANALYKLNVDGTVLINYSDDDYTGDIAGIVVLPDGSAWYSNDGNLYRVRQPTDGSTNRVVFVDTIENVSESNIDTIALDGDGSEALWVLDGFNFGRLWVSGDRKGTYEFQISMNSPVKLYPVPSGCWVWCSNVDDPSEAYYRFVSKVNKRIENEYKTGSYVSTPGSFENVYTDDGYTDLMPVAVDDTWENLPWEKINTNTFILSEDRYQQLKIYFRRQEAYDIYDSLPYGTGFINDDTFTQDDGEPENVQLWNGWRRATVVNNELELANDPGGTNNAYIRTYRRMVVGPSSSDKWEVRMYFRIGDGTPSGKAENIYMYAYASDESHSGDYFRVRLYVPSNAGPGVWSYIYVRANGLEYSDGLYQFQQYDNLILRLYKDSNDRIYGQVYWNGSWEGDDYIPNASDYGDYFYISMSSSYNGSDIYLTEFRTQQGYAYYYTETPELNSIYTQQPVTIGNIGSNTSKDLYLRSQIGTGLELEDLHETNLRVRWRLPVY